MFLEEVMAEKFMGLNIKEKFMLLCVLHIQTKFQKMLKNWVNLVMMPICKVLKEIKILDRLLSLTQYGQKKKGGGKLIVKEVFKKIKKSNHLNRLVTLSPLTDMAFKFHSKNGAKLLQVNETNAEF